MLNPEKYLIKKCSFEQIDWIADANQPMMVRATINNLIEITKEIFYNTPSGYITNHMLKFYISRNAVPFFWFSGENDNIGEIEIEYININLLKKFGDIEWKQLRG